MLLLNNMFSQRTVTSATLALKLSLIYIELIKSSSRTSGRLALFNSIYIQWYPQAFESRSSISCTGSMLQVQSCPQVLIRSNVPFCMGGRQRDLYSLRILIPHSLSHDIELSSVPLLCLCSVDNQTEGFICSTGLLHKVTVNIIMGKISQVVHTSCKRMV